MSGEEIVELILDSSFTSNSAESGFNAKDYPQFTLNSTLSNVRRLKVTEVSIPSTYYVIREGTGSDGFPYGSLEFDRGFGVPSYMVVPAGTYTAASMITTLTALALANGDTLVMTFDQNNGRFSFEITSGSGTGSAYLSAQNDELAFALGLNVGPAGNPMVKTVGNTVYTIALFPFVANLAGLNPLYVNSKSLGPLLRVNLPQGPYITGDSNPQLAMIPITGNFGEIIAWQNHDGEYLNCGNLFSLNRLDLYITNGFFSHPLRFNGLGFIVKLSVVLGNEAVAYMQQNYENDRNRVRIQS